MSSLTPSLFSRIKKAIASSLALCLFAQMAWGTQAAFPASSLSPSSPRALTNQPGTTAANLVHPDLLRFVRLKEFHGNLDGPLLYLLQDVHMNETAQVNLSQAIQILAEESDGRLVVGVEGTVGALDFGSLLRRGAQEARGKIADQFLAKGKIAAPEHAGLHLADDIAEKISFRGLEDAPLYLANVKAYQESAPQQEKWRREIDRFQKLISVLAGKKLPPEAVRFLKDRRDFHSQSLPLSDYVSRWRLEKEDVISFHLENFIQAQKIESSMDWDLLSRERKHLLTALAGRLNKKETAELTRLSQSLQEGTMDMGLYYSRFKGLILDKNVPLGNFPQFTRYLQYIQLSESLNPEKVFQGLVDWETSVISEFNLSSAEREIFQRDRVLQLKQKLVNFSLIPEEWDELNGAADDKPRLPQSFFDFYRFADQRNVSLVKNLGRFDRAVAVTGGFHTPGILKELKKQNMGIAVLTPKLKGTELSDESGYLTHFLERKTPWERFLSGTRLFLALPAGLAADQSQQPFLPEIRSNLTEEYFNEIRRFSQKAGRRQDLVQIDSDFKTGRKNIPYEKYEKKYLPPPADLEARIAEAGFRLIYAEPGDEAFVFNLKPSAAVDYLRMIHSEKGLTPEDRERLLNEYDADGITIWNHSPGSLEQLSGSNLAVNLPPDIKGLVVINRTHPFWHQNLLEETLHILEGPGNWSKENEVDVGEVFNDLFLLLFFPLDKLNEFHPYYTDWTLQERTRLYLHYVVSGESHPNERLEDFLHFLQKDFNPDHFGQQQESFLKLLFRKEIKRLSEKDQEPTHEEWGKYKPEIIRKTQVYLNQFQKNTEKISGPIFPHYKFNKALHQQIILDGTLPPFLWLQLYVGLLPSLAVQIFTPFMDWVPFFGWVSLAAAVFMFVHEAVAHPLGFLLSGQKMAWSPWINSRGWGLTAGRYSFMTHLFTAILSYLPLTVGAGALFFFSILPPGPAGVLAVAFLGLGLAQGMTVDELRLFTLSNDRSDWKNTSDRDLSRRAELEKDPAEPEPEEEQAEDVATGLELDYHLEAARPLVVSAPPLTPYDGIGIWARAVRANPRKQLLAAQWTHEEGVKTVTRLKDNTLKFDEWAGMKVMNTRGSYLSKIENDLNMVGEILLKLEDNNESVFSFESDHRKPLLEAINRLRSQLKSGLVFDLAARRFAETKKHLINDPKAELYLSVLWDSERRLSALVRNLHAMVSGGDQNKNGILKEDIFINSLIENTFREETKDKRLKKIEIIPEFEDSLSVQGDEVVLQRAFQILWRSIVSPLIKRDSLPQRRGPSDPRKILVKTSLSKDKESAKVEIRTARPILTEEEREKVEKFASSFTLPLLAAAQGASSFGWPSIVEIVRSHGGDLSITNLPGEGSLITIQIPLAHFDLFRRAGSARAPQINPGAPLGINFFHTLRDWAELIEADPSQSDGYADWVKLEMEKIIEKNLVQIHRFGEEETRLTQDAEGRISGQGFDVWTRFREQLRKDMSAFASLTGEERGRAFASKSIDWRKDLGKVKFFDKAAKAIHDNDILNHNPVFQDVLLEVSDLEARLDLILFHIQLLLLNSGNANGIFGELVDPNELLLRSIRWELTQSGEKFSSVKVDDSGLDPSLPRIRTIPPMASWIFYETFRNQAASTVRIVSSHGGNGNKKVHYEPVNGESRVALSSQYLPETREIQITMEDNGVGMTEDVLEEIQGFGRSTLSEKTSADKRELIKTGVSGVGVPLSMRKARVLGGDYKILSSPGEGTKVVITLPLSFFGRLEEKADSANMKKLFSDLHAWALRIQTKPSLGGVFSEWAIDRLISLAAENRRLVQEFDGILNTNVYQTKGESLALLEDLIKKDREKIAAAEKPGFLFKKNTGLAKAKIFEKAAAKRNQQLGAALPLTSLTQALRDISRQREKGETTLLDPFDPQNNQEISLILNQVADNEAALSFILDQAMLILPDRVFRPLGIFDPETDINQALINAFEVEVIDEKSLMQNVIRDLDLSPDLPRVKTVPDIIYFFARQAIKNAAGSMVKRKSNGSLSPLRDEKGRLTLATRFLEDKNQIEIRVRDEGVGMDPGTLHHIMEFGASRIYEDGAIRTGKLGIGTSTTRRLIEQIGGEYRIESVPGKGTTVIVTLPINFTEEQPETKAPDDETPSNGISNTDGRLSSPDSLDPYIMDPFLKSVRIYLDPWRFASIPREQWRFFLPASALFLGIYFLAPYLGLKGSLGIGVSLLLSGPIIFHPLLKRSFLSRHQNLIKEAHLFGLSEAEAYRRLSLLYVSLNIATLFSTLTLALIFPPVSGLLNASTALGLGQGAGAFLHALHNLIFSFPGSSGTLPRGRQKKRKFRAGALIVNLMDLGAYRKNNSFDYKNSLRSVIPLVHAAENLGYGSIYLTHGAYPIGHFGKSVHSVPTNGLHLIQGEGKGHILSSVENYSVRNTPVSKNLVITDRHGNNFAVTSLDLNPELSEGDVQKDFALVMQAAKKEKVNVIMDLFSWLDVSAITPDNYTQTFYRSLKQISESMRHRLENDSGYGDFLSTRESYFRPGETTPVPTDGGWWFLNNGLSAWDAVSNLPSLWKATKGSPEKRRELLEWLHIKNRDFAVLLVPEGRGVAPVFIHHLSTRAYGSANRDQIILNPFDSRVQETLLGAARKRIEDGVTKFRVDLGFRILKEEIQDFLTPEEKRKYLTSDQPEPLLEMVNKIIDFGREKDQEVEIIFESYDQAYRDLFLSWPDQVSVYYPDFYQNFVKDDIESLNFSIEYILSQLRQDGKGRLYIYPQNFDEKSLIWLRREHGRAIKTMLGLTSFLIQGGVKGFIPEELLMGMDPVLAQVGPDHPTATKQDIQTRFNFYKGSLARLIRVASPAKLIRSQPALLNGVPPEVTNNSNRSRFITLAGKTPQKETWAYFIGDFKENNEEPARVWATLPSSFYPDLPPEKRFEKALNEFEIEHIPSGENYSLQKEIEDPFSAALEIHPDDPARELRLYFPQPSSSGPALFKLKRKKPALAFLPLSVGLLWLTWGPDLLKGIRTFLGNPPPLREPNSSPRPSSSPDNWAPVQKLELSKLEGFLFAPIKANEDKNGLAILEVREENLEEAAEFLARERSVEPTDRKRLIILAENERVKERMDALAEKNPWAAAVISQSDAVGQEGDINLAKLIEKAFQINSALGIKPGDNIHLYASTLRWEGADEVTLNGEAFSLSSFNVRFYYAGQVLEFLEGLDLGLKTSFETRLEALKLALKAA